METLKVFEQKFHDIIGDNIQSVLLDNELTEPEEPEKWQPEDQTSLKCSYCRAEFGGVPQQREHYKLDWHRYNLRQSLLGKQPIGEEEFGKKTGNDDISSISGSDTESNDEQGVDAFATAQGKIFLRACGPTKSIFSMYACLLYASKKEEIRSETLAERVRSCCVANKRWTILMLGGGHFAGAVFDGHEPVLHKTFHCYTVRAGQGGSQSARDGRSATSHPKSAGASLRRYNEQALVQHVRGILETWTKEIASSSLVLYRASGPYNRGVLFGGSPALLDRADNRLRPIPFSTRRPTFAEVKRVHSILTVAQIFDDPEKASEHFSRQKQPELKQRTKAQINRSKSREVAVRPDPCGQSSSGSSGQDSDHELSLQMQDISFEDLVEFTDTLTPEQRQQGDRVNQKAKKKKKKPHRKSKTQKLKEQEDKKRSDLIELIVAGDLETLRKIVRKSPLETASEDDDGVQLDGAVDDEGNTMFHVAALHGRMEVVRFLLENEADLCVKNKKQQTAYSCSQNRDVREALRQFARDNPEKYNYNKAQIPVNALTPEEQAEKKKELRKVKKEKEKIKRKQDDIRRKEQEEKDRFLKLSDREKRALAAERRILQSGAVFADARCFLCAADIAGKVPFEYGGNRFCTIDCLKAHRMAHPITLS